MKSCSARAILYFYSMILAVLVLVPLTYATAQSALKLRRHRKKIELGMETSQTKRLRGAEYQLALFSVFIAHFFILCAYYTSSTLPGTKYLAPMPYVCWYPYTSNFR